MSETISLQQRIIERIQRDGPLPFADYMRMALYEPGYGYYVTGPAHMGWSGDYFTSSDVSPLFAHCLGRQLVRLWEQLDQPSPFIVLEQGAGRGEIARAVRAWFAQEHPTIALDYHTTDIHAGQDALTMLDIRPHVLFSNELVDAFPVHVLQKYEGRLYEVYVDVHHGRLHEVLDTPEHPEVALYLDTYAPSWHDYPDGWRAEVNLDALRWLRQSATVLAPHGFLLTLDYGDEADALYTESRPRGTLACYYQHQFTERPLARPGEQDITAHVNFTALLDEGKRHDLSLHTLTTQRAWLEQMGIQEELAQIRARDFAALDSDRASDKGQVALLQWYNLRQRVSTLLDPVGMGNFKVLLLRASR
jgi:SAM-dependent MidA family methyltransferase